MANLLNRGTISVNRPQDKRKAIFYDLLVAIFQAYADDERVDKDTLNDVLYFNNHHAKGRKPLITDLSVNFDSDFVEKNEPLNRRKRSMYYALLHFVDDVFTIEFEGGDSVYTTAERILEKCSLQKYGGLVEYALTKSVELDDEDGDEESADAPDEEITF
jgi:hypothetical protein